MTSSLLFGNCRAISPVADLNNFDFIYMIVCNFDKPVNNKYVKWTKILGKSYLLSRYNSILIRSNDMHGSYKYVCSLRHSTLKESDIVFSFELTRCTNDCAHSNKSLQYKPQPNILILDLRASKIRHNRLLLAMPSTPLSEPNIHFYLIAVGLSVVLAIIIVILCIMCYEPYEKSLSDASIEDESIQANIKSPPCTDLMKIDGEDDKQVCKEFKKSAYDHLRGSRRTFFSIEDMKGNVNHGGDGLCPMDPKYKDISRGVCPMNQHFRQPVDATCPSCPNFPDPHAPGGYQDNGCLYDQDPACANPQLIAPQGPYQNYQNFPNLRSQELSQDRKNLLPIVSSTETSQGYANDRPPGGQGTQMDGAVGRFRTNQKASNNYAMYGNITRPSNFSMYSNPQSSGQQHQQLQPKPHQMPRPPQMPPQPQLQMQRQPNNNQQFPGNTLQANQTYVYPMIPEITNNPVFVNAPEPNNSPIFVNSPQPNYLMQHQTIQPPAELEMPYSGDDNPTDVKERRSERPPRQRNGESMRKGHVRESHKNRRVSSSTRTSETFESDDTHRKKCKKYAKQRVKERRRD